MIFLFTPHAVSYTHLDVYKRQALRHRRQPMGAETKTPMYHAGQLKIDFDKRRVFLGEEEIRLTPVSYTHL